ncbi:PREDICTED: aspartic proteinase-like protein 2 isoform X1 [Ipomoea nil]|uniref:aspartic proteinase-like protein 2 isoform X1 n=1 Tax=Ipomoea nil TaxID=35883 RepID=UPI000901287D|nr:PREDICTED: aspartic proteinase-like protein 2 isoform X1 [Ipomoea nil]
MAMVDMRLLVVVVAVLVAAAAVAEGNVVFKVKHKYGGRGSSVLTELKAHDSRRHGRMLASVDFHLGGNGQPTDAALYYTKLSMGTPPIDYHVQVDTGSDILWVNCAGCDKCPEKSNLGIELKLYDIKASSSAKAITCDQDLCTTMFNAPYSDCKVGLACEYQVTYGDGSATAGYFVKDEVHFDQVTGNLKTGPMTGSVGFGCSAKQSGELGTSTAAVDGIIGFGQANSSVISQLAEAGKVKKIFSHCLDNHHGGGIFAIGEVVEPKLKSTPIVQDEPHYNVVMERIEVGGSVVDIRTSFFDLGTRDMIIDSGTTLAYLPDSMYSPLMNKLMEKQGDLGIHKVEGFKCFDYDENVDDGFPVVTFTFKDSLKLTVYPHDYLFEVRENEYCFGWQNSGIQTKDGKEMTLLGDLVLSGKLIVYDLEKQTISMTEYNCSSSIKVKDEASGNAYAVGAHDISLSNFGWSYTGNVYIMGLLISFLCNLMN